VASQAWRGYRARIQEVATFSVDVSGAAGPLPSFALKDTPRKRFGVMI